VSQPYYKAERLSDLIERDLPPVPAYIGPAVLPVGGQLVFGGHAKVGKSMLMLEFARALASGDVPFGCPEFFTTSPVRVLLVEQELGEHGLRQRAARIWTPDEMHRLGRRMDNLYYVSKIPELKLDTSIGRRILRDLCDDIKPHVLILDPIGRMHSYDENNAQDMAKMFGSLDEIQKSQESQNMALIFSHHFGKPKDERGGFDPLDPYAFRGSSKFFDNPDTLITVQRCAELSKPHEAWSLKVRFTLRHGECPDDLIFHCNEMNDMRVRYVKHVGGKFAGQKALPKPVPKQLEVVPKQEMITGFRAA
jgi:RecA-family ATPase